MRQISSLSRVALLAALIVAGSGASAPAQSGTGEVRGRVVDVLDEAIPGTRVRLLAPSGAEQTTVTSPGGDFRFVRVPPGTYRLIYELVGFYSVVHQRVVVDDGVRQLRAVMQPAALHGREILPLEGRLTAPLPRVPTEVREGEIAIYIELAFGNATLAIDPRSAPAIAAQLMDDVDTHALDSGRILIDVDTLPEPEWRRRWSSWRWRIEEQSDGGMTVAMTRRGQGPIVARVVTGAGPLRKLRAESTSQPWPILAASRLHRD